MEYGAFLHHLPVNVIARVFIDVLCHVLQLHVLFHVANHHLAVKLAWISDVFRFAVAVVFVDVDVVGHAHFVDKIPVKSLTTQIFHQFVVFRTHRVAKPALKPVLIVQNGLYMRRSVVVELLVRFVECQQFERFQCFESKHHPVFRHIFSFQSEKRWHIGNIAFCQIYVGVAAIQRGGFGNYVVHVPLLICICIEKVAHIYFIHII